MPLSKKDKQVLRQFELEYGKGKGKKVFYATLNKSISEGKPIQLPETKRLAKKRHKKTHKGGKKS